MWLVGWLVQLAAGAAALLRIESTSTVPDLWPNAG